MTEPSYMARFMIALKGTRVTIIIPEGHEKRKRSFRLREEKTMQLSECKLTYLQVSLALFVRKYAQMS